jgi:hypothetical protein
MSDDRPRDAGGGGSGSGGGGGGGGGGRGGEALAGDYRPTEGDAAGLAATPAPADAADITNSPALVFLAAMLEQGKIEPARAELLRAKYAKLHSVLLS